MSKKIIPKKSLGQNFLIDKNIVKKIVKLIDFNLFESIVEIGPGQGAITNLIYNSANKLILIEIDNNLSETLKNSFPNAIIYNENFLTWQEPEKLQNTLAIGNLPYNISTQIIFKVLSQVNIYKQAIFMLQREVADRVVATNNSKNFSLLSVICQSFSNPKVVFNISPNCFYPKPKIVSSIVTFDINNKFNIKNFDDFFLFIKAFFYGKRKKLINGLLSNPFINFSENFIIFFKNNFNTNTRINDLTLTQIISLYKTYKKDTNESF